MSEEMRELIINSTDAVLIDTYRIIVAENAKNLNNLERLQLEITIRDEIIRRMSR